MWDLRRPSGRADGSRPLERVLRRRKHHRARGSRGGPPAPGDVHRLDRRAGSAPPRLGDPRQRRRRGAGRLLHGGRDHAARRRLGHVPRQRPRHPRRDDGRAGHVGGRGRADEAARRRQVRRRRLQGLGRPARRRRLGGQRAQRAPPRGDPPRRVRLDAGLHARRPADAADQGRGVGRGHRHRDHLHARHRDLRGHPLRPRHAGLPHARDGVPHRRPLAAPDRRARRRLRRDLALRGRHRRVRGVHEPRQGARAPRRRHRRRAR